MHNEIGAILHPTLSKRSLRHREEESFTQCHTASVWRLRLRVFAPFARETSSQGEGVGADPPPSSIQLWEDPRWLQHLCSQPPLPASGVCSSCHEAPGKLKLSSPKPRPDRLSLLPLFNLLKEMRRKSNAVPRGLSLAAPRQEGGRLSGCPLGAEGDAPVASDNAGRQKLRQQAGCSLNV